MDFSTGNWEGSPLRGRSLTRSPLLIEVFSPFLDGGEKTNDLNLLWQPSRGKESISGEDKRLSSSPWRALLDCLAAEG